MPEVIGAFLRTECETSAPILRERRGMVGWTERLRRRAGFVEGCGWCICSGAGTELLVSELEPRTTMTPLRQRMIDDMRLAGFAERTRDVYIQAVRRLAAHYMRSPDVLSEEEVRAYLLHLRDERGIARGTFKTNHGGIRFLYSRTLDRDWPLFSQKNAFVRRGSSACRPCSLMPRSTPSWLRCAIRSTGPAFN